ncbi:hypothetical protein [Chryseobacterium pennae]|uniref:hypothetical protein n=1 Tax=Chryseobacterium pennae TaxID=2258962 RepID=UPI000F4F0CEB|nr:hypothetical protein [Chryseobacterium pennae]
MKKTIISITLMLLAFASIYSCRIDDMDQQTENQITLVKNQEKRNYLRSNKDSVQTSQNHDFNENESTVLDPPPKDRDHW